MPQKQSGLIVHTEGSPWRLLLLFSLPLMAGNIFQQMYTVVDTAVVGKVLGVDALAALGTVDWLNWLTLGTIQGFTQGFSILMAQRFGAGDFARLRRTAASAILLSALCGVLLTAGSEAAAEPVAALLRVPAGQLLAWIAAALLARAAWAAVIRITTVPGILRLILASPI